MSTNKGQEISRTTNLTNPQLSAAGTGVYTDAQKAQQEGLRSSSSTAVVNGNGYHHASDEHQYGGLAMAPVTTGEGNHRKMVTQPSLFSLGSTPDGNPDQPALLERRESIIIEEQLPGFMKVDEKEHKHRHHYRAALRRRLEIKNNIIAFVSEFVGTVLFLFFAFGIATQAANARSSTQHNGDATSLSQNAPPDTNALLFSSLGFGFSLALLHLTIAQFAGGIAAAALTTGILPGNINARTTLANGTNIAQGFWLEFFLTCQLILAIFLLAAEKHRGTFLAPVGIGLALFLAELLGTNYTGGSLNPARTLGPNVVLGLFESYDWIYFIAPYAAAVVTAGFYQGLKYFQYESANIGQDADDSKQVFKDAYGNLVGVLETMSASEFSFVKAAAQPAENESTHSVHTVVSSSSRDQGLTAAGMVKKARHDQEKAAAVSLAPSEVNNNVA
ncbi:uncharacterized protein UHO2_03790 [Ustilago hordei]|uniref:uncharacterized protein n=1 Tax=Ustilago hordei TaxID=120017 RepID=UPI001A56621E|nr:uncharacterized protein UHO2_03790 [Ustilago hordei]SYW76061.1 related to aquaporin [Ustilago hordei]